MGQTVRFSMAVSVFKFQMDLLCQFVVFVLIFSYFLYSNLFVHILHSLQHSLSISLMHCVATFIHVAAFVLSLICYKQIQFFLYNPTYRSIWTNNKNPTQYYSLLAIIENALERLKGAQNLEPKKKYIYETRGLGNSWKQS